MVMVAAAITAVESQPSPPKTQPARKSPILWRLPATYINAAIIGTAMTPFSTALQYSALIGSIGDQPMPSPGRVEAPITEKNPRACQGMLSSPDFQPCPSATA